MKFMNGDHVSDLTIRLSELPNELEGLYDRMLDNLVPRHKYHAAQYFYLMLSSVRRPEPLLFAFADDIDEKPHISINMPKASLPE